MENFIIDFGIVTAGGCFEGNMMVSAETSEEAMKIAAETIDEVTAGIMEGMENDL